MTADANAARAAEGPSDGRPPVDGLSTAPAAALADLSARVGEAARAVFDARGLAGPAVRSLGSLAPGVARSVIRNRQQVLASALRVPFDPGSAMPMLIANGLDGVGERLVRVTVSLADDPSVRQDVSRLTEGGPLGGLAQVVPMGLLDRLVGVLGVPDARARVGVAMAQLVGLAAARAVLRIDPISVADPDDVVAWFAPGIQRLLDPTVPFPGHGTGAAP